MLKPAAIFVLLLMFCAMVVSAETKLSFRFSGNPNTAISIVINQNVLNNYAGQTLATGNSDAEGDFNCTLNMPEPTFAKVFAGKTFYQVWLDNGNLIINEDQSSLSFAGSLGPQNDFLYQAKFMQPYLIPAPTAYKKENYLGYVRQTDSLLNVRLSLLQKLKHQQKVPAVFIENMRNESLNASIYAKNQFALLQKIDLSTGPADYFAFWGDFKLPNDDPSQRNYMDALRDFIAFKVAEKHVKSPVGQSGLIKEQFIYMDSLLRSNPLTKEHLKGELLLFLIKYYNDTALIGSLAATFAADYPHSAFRTPVAKAMEARYARQHQKISFTLKNEKGEAISTENFKGKLVYIDFWGSWCKACLHEMPAAKKMREHFKGKDIIFLYLNFHDTRERWLNAIKTQGLADGINLKAEKPDEAYFETHFGIEGGFPRYAVLDQDGNLISTVVSPPSNTETITYLETLLSK